MPSLNHKKGPHRRAFSSSASDKIAQRPIPALRKLKLRLSAVSESAVLESDTSLSSIPGADLSMSSLPVNGSVDNKKITIASGSNTKKSNGNSKQPKNKRQRTQSMSHRTNTTASFPFDDLHLHYSMQQAALQAGSSSSFNASTSLSDGTLYPFEMHIPSSPQNALDLLTSRSAPEGNIFSPALAGHNANVTVGNTAGSYVAGPFSRSHSPSSSLLHYHRQQAGRRSLPPDYGNEDVQGQKAELEYDGWGMESDHALAGGRVLSPSASRNGKNASDADAAGMEDSFHEAMLKNDDIDFAFDFSLGSLGESASRLNIQENGGNDSVNLSSELDGPDALREEGEAEERKFSRSASILDVSNDSSGNQQSSHLESFFDGLGEENDNSRETVKEKRKKSRSVEKDVDMSGEGNDSTLEAEQEDDQEEEEEEMIQEAEEEERDQASPSAILDRKAFEKALSTTLCPAAAKFSIDDAKPGRLLTKRTNSSSGLTFARALPRSSEAPKDQIQAPTTSLLRPPSVSRTNSRDVLSTAVPLAELPSIPLENNRRDSFLFYHLTSDAAHPLDFSSASHSTLMEGKENRDQQSDSTRDDMSDAASSSSASSSSSLLTRIVKSEEELDEMVDMEEHDEDVQQDSPATRRGVSRCCSIASATSRAEVESNDSFNSEMIYPIGRRAPSAELGNIGGQGEIDELHHQQNSRSQSSSRTTSLSPRDSFSPHMVGPHGSSSELDADWALTPPSEEEHVDEEEKNLDRATMLGIESVGMEDFDDVWPGVRRSLGANAVNGNIEAQVDGVTSGFKIMEVFEPVLSAAPIPQAELPPSFVFPKTLRSGEDSENEDTVMEVDQTPMDEHTAAAMFIADESLHPPKPAPIVTVTAASEDGLQNTPQPSLSPVSAAARDATSAADAQQVTSHTVNVLQQQKSASSEAGRATTSTSATNQVPSQPASTQSFLFYPDKPFHPEISILLTDTKILFYSTIVNVSNDGRPLLRRVDNDAVDAEALLLSLEGASDLDVDRVETLRKIKELGNTWVSIDFARELLNKYGGPEPLVSLRPALLSCLPHVI